MQKGVSSKAFKIVFYSKNTRKMNVGRLCTAFLPIFTQLGEPAKKQLSNISLSTEDLTFLVTQATPRGKLKNT